MRGITLPGTGGSLSVRTERRSDPTERRCGSRASPTRSSDPTRRHRDRTDGHRDRTDGDLGPTGRRSDRSVVRSDRTGVHPAGGSTCPDRGAVTVEAAFASVGLVALLAVLVSAIGVVVVQVECVDAAGAIARQAARGDATGIAEAERHLPKDGHLTIRTTASTVTVRVEANPSIIPGSPVTIDLAAESTAVLEPGGSS